MDAAAIATIWTIPAIIAGPIIAVMVTRYLDRMRLERDRQMNVFRSLMSTRRMALTQEHVGALNLVRVEFDGQTKVIEALNTYMVTLEEKLPPGAPVEDHRALNDKRDTKLTELLWAISQRLKFKIQQLEILKGGYVPQGWQDDLERQRALQHYLLQIVSGQRPFPVTYLAVPAPGGPFPPAPTTPASAPSPPAQDVPPKTQPQRKVGKG